MVDFLVEFTYPEETEETESVSLPADQQTTILTWVLYVNGSSNHQGSRARVILTTPEGIQLEYALRFGFRASNNKADYEARLVGL